jgi:hypothetical protein
MCGDRRENDLRASGILQNMGGPRSRSREESINSDFLADNKLERGGTDLYAIRIKEGLDPETVLLNHAESIRLYGWFDINRAISLPNKKMLVRPGNEGSEIGEHDPRSLLRTAMILARCNALWYDPEGPAIYTRSRLERAVRLVEFNAEDFYELV